MTITIALTILGIFLSITFSLNSFVKQMESNIEITAFLEEKADYQFALEQIRKQSLVNSVEFVSKERALEEFTTDRELKELIEIIDYNPLPASVQIWLNREGLSKEKVEELVSSVGQIKGVAEVRYARQWLSQLLNVLQLLRKISLTIGVALLIGVFFIISNTVRLTVFLNADKIGIMRLVGATPSFIQGPYLVQGAIQGFLGGLLAVSLLKLGLFLLVPAQSGIISLPLTISFVIIFIGVFLGGGASFVAVRKFLPVTFR